MKLPYSVKTTTIIFIVWVFFSSIFLYFSREDNGQFAQIAIPVLFGGLHLVLSFILLTSVFKDYKDKLNFRFKLFTICIILLPLLLAFIFVPLYSIMFGF